MFNYEKTIGFLMDQGWGLYLICILSAYGHKPWESSFWVIYAPTMILVCLAKVRATIRGDDDKWDRK